MRTWSDLFGEVDRLDLAERRAAASRARFEQWAAAAEQAAMSAAHAAAVDRAAELLRQTGLVVHVAGPEVTPERSTDGVHWAAVSLTVGASRVDLYSVRHPGQSPALHLAVLRAATSTRHPVLTTVPGALVVRDDDGGYELLALPLPYDPAERRPRTTVDALLLRAFALLVGTHHSLELAATLPGPA